MGEIVYLSTRRKAVAPKVQLAMPGINIQSEQLEVLAEARRLARETAQLLAEYDRALRLAEKTLAIGQRIMKECE